MKKLFTIAVIFVTALSVNSAKAQLNISLSLNIGNQPTWGPVGYDHVDYYYLPDIDCYYDVPHQQFIYLSGNTWLRSSTLPARYRNYDLYNGYKVVVNQPTPYLHSATYRTKYASYKGRRGQTIIRDSRDPKYTKYHGNRPVVRPPAKPSRPVVRPKPSRPVGPQRPPANNKPGRPDRPGDNRPDRPNDHH